MSLLLQSKIENSMKSKKRRHSIGKYIVIDSECDEEIIVKKSGRGKENRMEEGYSNLRSGFNSL